jgi:coenzyme F420-reducing hydrogenase alpha subunit
VADTKTIRVDLLARVEGEGGLYVRLKGGKVQEVKLRVVEPPRFFEAFLVGRRYDEAPDITSRICGICPIAYLLGASLAMENALGIRVDGPLRDLRRLVYCGEWIESHALHLHLLHAPDFLGYQDGLEMAKDHPEVVRRGLRIKKAGNDLTALIGGREVHPVNLRVGGFYKVPRKSDLLWLRDGLAWGLEASLEVVEMVAGFDIPAFERDYHFVAMRHPDEYAIHEGPLVDSSGGTYPVEAFETHFLEEQVEHSTALHGHTAAGGEYHVGPLARYSLNSAQLTPAAAAAAKDAGLGPDCRNPFRSIVVRAVESVLAFEEALRLIDAYEEPDRPFVSHEVRAGRGCGCTEAPRGICYHRYEIDDQGLIVSAHIRSPTCQNQPAIEEDLRELVPTLLDLPDEQIQWRCEQAVRNYDPCISCATHFLRLHLDRT